MAMKSTIQSLACSLIFLWSHSAAAQWTSDAEANTLACSSALDIVEALAASDGSTFIVYWKSVGPPANIELRLQRLDSMGIPMMGSDGILVSSDIDMSTSTAISTAVLDAADHLYIGVTATGDEEGHVFKLDADGNHLWPTTGVTFSSGYSISILPLSDGGAAVSWLNIPNALMQRYDDAGLPVWIDPQPIESGSNKTAPGQLIALSNGDVEHIFHTYNFGISSTLWAQRYSGTTGEAVWSNPVQLSNKTTVWNTRYSTGQNGDVVYLGYKASTGIRFDSFLQRIDPDGGLPWGINGSDFDVNETDYEMDTRIAMGEGVVWSLCNYKDPSQIDNGERIQLFDGESGVRLFTENAKEVYGIGSENVHAGNLHLIDGNPIFLIESGFDAGVSATSLHLVALDEDGDFVWPEEMQPMGLFEANKSRIHLTNPVNGQTVAVWLEDKLNGPAVFAHAHSFDTAQSLWLDSSMQAEALAFPNPASDVVHILTTSHPESKLTFEAVNALGQRQHPEELNVMSHARGFQVQVSDWPVGLYHLVGWKSEGEKTLQVSFVVSR